MTDYISDLISLGAPSAKVTDVITDNDTKYVFIEKKDCCMYCSTCGSRMKSKGPRIKQINPCLHFGESRTNIAKRLFRFQEKPFCDKICLFSKAAVPHLLPLSSNTNICSYHQNRYPEDIIFGKLPSHADDSDSSGMNRPADAILFQQLRVSFSHWQCRCGCRYDILLKQT